MRYTGIEGLTEWLAHLQSLESHVQRVQELAARRHILVQGADCAQCDAYSGDEITRGLIDLDYFCRLHQQVIVGNPTCLCQAIKIITVAQAGPEMESKRVRAAIAPTGTQAYLLVMAIAG